MPRFKGVLKENVYFNFVNIDDNKHKVRFFDVDHSDLKCYYPIIGKILHNHKSSKMSLDEINEALECIEATCFLMEETDIYDVYEIWDNRLIDKDIRKRAIAPKDDKSI